MKYFSAVIFILLSLTLTSCNDGGNGNGNGNNGELTGVWRSDFNNILYLINQNEGVVTLNECNSDEPFPLTESGDELKSGSTPIIKINSPSQLEFIIDSLSGKQLNKVSDSNKFNSGSLSISSNNAIALSVTTDVCAYREEDNVFNIIRAPYIDGYIELVVAIQLQTTGTFSIPFDDASIRIESDNISGGSVSAYSGTINVTEYSNELLEASFNFVDSDGNEYSGNINVKL